MNTRDSSSSIQAGTQTPLCPECRSATVTTRAKRPDAESYWRCEACGEVWNIGRRQHTVSAGRSWR